MSKDRDRHFSEMLANFDDTRWCYGGRHSSDVIATTYRVDGPELEPRWSRHFPHPFRPAPRPTQPPVQWVTDFFPRGKTAGAWR